MHIEFTRWVGKMLFLRDFIWSSMQQLKKGNSSLIEFSNNIDFPSAEKFLTHLIVIETPSSLITTCE